MNHEELGNVSAPTNHPATAAGEDHTSAGQAPPLVPKEIPSEEDRQRCADMYWALDDPEVQGRYAGKYVAVYQKQVLAAGVDLQAVYAEAQEKSGLPRGRIAIAAIDDDQAFREN
jgi:hypothetical protein